jgi:ABC-type Fe3+-hydroxamate transport system substrate-binding protein
VIHVEDDVGREVELPHAAQRIISLVPSLTEALFVLGCGESVVGVTRYCTEPAGKVERVERVGGTKTPNLGRIRQLQPNLVLLDAEENRKEDFEALEQAGLTVFVSFPRRVRDVGGLLRRIGRLTGTDPRAAQLAGELENTLEDLARADPAPPVRVFCPIWKNPWMSFNRETYAHDMLALAGGLNICAEGAERYGTIVLSEIAAAQPEIILLPDEPYVFTSKVLPDLQPLRHTPAWCANRVRFIDGKELCWYGPRTAPALRHLRALLGVDSRELIEQKR